MKRKNILLMVLLLILTLGFFSSVGAEIPSEAVGQIKNASIGGLGGGGNVDPINAVNTLSFKILGIAKLFISGLALIWLVLIGVYMVVFSENEERVKTQKKQLIYTLIGFLFLNVPGVAYQIFFSVPKNNEVIAGNPAGGWSSIMGGLFWDDTILNGFLSNFIGFFQVFIFAIAIVMFTWGLFQMILSGGNEEVQKKAKNRIIYGTVALIFMGFIRFWGMIIAKGDFAGDITSIAGKAFALALFFAGPIAIFFLIWGGYYYITSGGDEERTKKGKSIVINTFIATLILLAAYSFLTDLINFTR